MNGLFNSLQSNEEITSQDFLDVYNYTNKIFSDGELFADPEIALQTKSSYRLGWGNNKIILPNKLITAYDWNQVITRCNLIINHTGIDFNFINRVPRKTQISHQKLTQIQNILNAVTENVSNINVLPRYNYIKPSHLTIDYVRNIIRSDTWYDEIDTIIQYEQSHYNDIRYFFNSGASYQYILSTANTSGYGMAAIVDIIQDLGTLVFDIKNFRCTNGTGITTNKNYLDLNKNNWTLLWTSNAGNATSGYGGYGGYGGSYSSSRIKVYGMLSSLYESVLIKFVYLSTESTIVQGIIEMDLFLGYKTDTSRYGIVDHQTLPNINIINTL